MRTLLLMLGLTASLAVAAPARADLPPPNTTGCDMKAAGDACKADDGSEHTCTMQKCSKIDPADGGTIEFDCLVCDGPASPTASSSSGAGGGGGSGGSASTSSTGAGASGGGDDAAGDSGCAIRSRAARSAASAWALGAAVLLISRRLRSGRSKRRG